MHNNFKSKLITLIWNTSLSYRLKRRLMLFIKYFRRKKPFGYGNLIYCRSYVEYLVFKFKHPNKIYLVYDYNDAPSTIGDFFNFLMLARFLYLDSFKIHIILIRSFDNPIYRIHDLLIEAIGFEAKKETFVNLEDFISNAKKKDVFIPFEREIMRKTQAQKYYFNFLNILSMKQNEVFLKNFLLKDLAEIPKDFQSFFKINEGNICIHCRYSPKNKDVRDTSKEQFIKMVTEISKKYWNKKIFIITDIDGYNFFKKLSEENSLNCYFTKDFFNSFILDCQFVLKSFRYFQLNGGGMSSVIYFSDVPYLICAQIISVEKPYSQLKKNPWSTENQIFSEISINEEFYHKLKEYN